MRPSSRVEIQVSPEYSRSRVAAQYVDRTAVLPYQPTLGSRYLFGELELQELSMEARLDITFNPTMTLQVFAQPLISSGDYLTYGQLQTAGTFDFDQFEEGAYQTASMLPVCVGGRTCVDGDGVRYVDFDRDGTVDHAFDDLDFSVQSLVGNVVFRWEYRPGSTLFLVWQRQQESESSVGRFRFGRDIDSLFGAPSENVFMIKLNYWFGI
jgi:hypothetical protein